VDEPIQTSPKILLTLDNKVERPNLTSGQKLGKWFAIEQCDWDRKYLCSQRAPEQVLRWFVVALN
jgi:hypothetical protein